jgi:tRNA uridine 5-carboxymethylaminomethyl modification enzyme
MAISAKYDVVVVGGGHAGIEAAHAAWKLGVKTALLTMSIDAIGRMSCNPAVGGVAKGQIVRDIDALGGLMGKLTDRAGIQFRMLNKSKGPAVWGPRAQCDMDYYSKCAREALEKCSGLELLEGELSVFTPSISEIDLQLLDGRKISTKTLIIPSGTFLASKMYTGLLQSIGGRVGEPSADELSKTLAALKIPLRRLKTGTPSRIDPDSVDFSECEVQHGDIDPWPFSDSTKVPLRNDAVCWITRTTLKTHEILRSGFKDSPMFSGIIKGKGPRYCPSIEDKINRFGDKDGHQLFLEPETASIGRIYINGFSSSLPAEIQLEAIHSIPGLSRAKVCQIGYAVEYDSVDATSLFPTLESKQVSGLYFAGQVCGTSGYEEAAGQGLMAGINAALKVKGESPFILGRSESYIGVMLDDLVNTLLDEPYRMFTSRAEYRLFLRSDNAEKRLKEKAYAIGMLSKEEFAVYESKAVEIAKIRERMRSESGTPEQINEIINGLGQASVNERTRWVSVLRRPGIEPEKFFKIAFPESTLSRRDKLFILSEEMYAGFFERQEKEIREQRKVEKVRLDENMDYMAIQALSIESRQKLAAARPLSLGQAARVPGIRPVDITVLMHWLENH